MALFTTRNTPPPRPPRNALGQLHLQPEGSTRNPRFVSFPRPPPAQPPHSPASLASALVLLSPALLVWLFPKEQEAGFSSQTHQGPGGAQGHPPPKRGMGMRCCGSLEAPSRGRRGPLRIHWVLTCKSLQNCDVLPPLPGGAPVVEGSLELEFRHNACAHALSQCSCGWVS